MAVVMRALVIGLLVFGAAAESTKTKVTPVQKVIELLTGISKKIEQEGKTEAAQYDKYACFCKEQADGKIYAIEKSTAKINKLTVEIGDLDGEITVLSGAIQELTTQITGLEGEIDTKTKTRQKEHERYLWKAQDMNEAITATEEAIKALTESKAELADAKLNLAQIRQVAKRLRSSVSRQPSMALPGVLALIGELEEAPGQPARYTYHSNGIIGLLEDLLKKFKGMKKDLDEAEFKTKAIFDKDLLGLTNEKKFAEKDRAEKDAVLEAKTEEREQKQAEKDQETKEKTADEEFLEVLKDECEEKAELWDQRSKMRAEELEAIDKALTHLKEGVSPNWKANKMLVGLQKSANSAAKLSTVASHAAASLLQLDSASSSLEATKEAAMTKRVEEALAASARHLGSSVLLAAASRVHMADDKFVKVRQIIKDLVEKLEQDASDEATQKGICDEGMTNAMGKRDSAKAEIEKTRAAYAVNKADKELLLNEIDALKQKIADEQKALLEATELRQEEHAENSKRIAMSAEGKAAVEMAMNVLKQFYAGALPTPAPQPTPPPQRPPPPVPPTFPPTLLQMAAAYEPYVAPDSDREGNTVGDLAPEVFDTSYHGKQQESEGIIGILEVIYSDFDRTEFKTTKEENEAQSEYDTFKSETEASIKNSEASIKMKTGEVQTIEQDMLQQEEYLKQQKALLDSAEEELEALKPMCVDTESWEERKAKREKEVEALKSALEILESWRD